jgi:hypothetical protein
MGPKGAAGQIVFEEGAGLRLAKEAKVREARHRDNIVWLEELLGRSITDEERRLCNEASFACDKEWDTYADDDQTLDNYTQCLRRQLMPLIKKSSSS